MPRGLTCLFWLPSSLRNQCLGPQIPPGDLLPEFLPTQYTSDPHPAFSPIPEALPCLVLGSWCVGGLAEKRGEEGCPRAQCPPGHTCLSTFHVRLMCSGTGDPTPAPPIPREMKARSKKGCFGGQGLKLASDSWLTLNATLKDGRDKGLGTVP